MKEKWRKSGGKVKEKKRFPIKFFDRYSKKKKKTVNRHFQEGVESYSPRKKSDVLFSTLEIEVTVKPVQARSSPFKKKLEHAQFFEGNRFLVSVSRYFAFLFAVGLI